MNNHLDRIQHLRGTPYEIGLAAGRALGAKLEDTIDTYIAGRAHASDMSKLHQGALPWLRSLPKRFQEEYEGLAEGTQLPLQRLVEWSYIEECEINQCSGAICMLDGHAWVARNNDTFVPELWGYVTIREVDGRIPTINFSMQGDIFTPTGINKKKLWLHYNYLDVWDTVEPGRPHIPAYVFLTEALEVCSSIQDVEALLNETDRDGGMMLFAVDGKTNEFAIFECLCTKHVRRDPIEGWMVGTNHFCILKDLTLGDDEGSISTLKRFARLKRLIENLYTAAAAPCIPTDLIQTLADDEIERRNQELVTAYANVACPASGELSYTFGGYPAASAANCQRLAWPWSA